MLKTKLKEMIDQHGKAKTEKIINDELTRLNEKMRSATNIYQAIDIEHDILDQKAMLRWLKKHV